jgi:hypothetical protein
MALSNQKKHESDGLNNDRHNEKSVDEKIPAHTSRMIIVAAHDTPHHAHNTPHPPPLHQISRVPELTRDSSSCFHAGLI